MIGQFAEQAAMITYDEFDRPSQFDNYPSICLNWYNLDEIESIDLDIEALIKFNNIKKLTSDDLSKFLKMFTPETRSLYYKFGKYRGVRSCKDLYSQSRYETKKRKKELAISEASGELWKKHPFHNVMVSNFGRVRNKNNRLVGKKGVITLNKHRLRVERLVVQTFLTCKPGQTIGFIDGNKSNFRLDNLFIKNQGN